MRGDLDGNARAGERLARDDALGPRSGGDAADARHRPEKIDEVGDIVRSHVEHGTAAGEVIEARIGMPALMARAHEERRAADRPADQPLIDGAARGLVGAAEKGVGRAAEPQALGRRGFDQAARLGDGDAERLFRVDVLAGGDRLEADFNMRVRNREVQDDLDRRIGKQRVDRRAPERRIPPRAPPPPPDWRRRARRG